MKNSIIDLSRRSLTWHLKAHGLLCSRGVGEKPTPVKGLCGTHPTRQSRLGALPAGSSGSGRVTPELPFALALLPPLLVIRKFCPGLIGACSWRVGSAFSRVAFRPVHWEGPVL